jgi:hypothetical protein
MLEHNRVRYTVLDPIAALTQHLEATTGPAIEGDELSACLYAITCKVNVDILDAVNPQANRQLKLPPTVLQQLGDNIPTLSLIYSGPGTPMFDANFCHIATRTGGHYDALRPRQPGNSRLSAGDRQ